MVSLLTSSVVFVVRAVAVAVFFYAAFGWMVTGLPWPY